MEYHTKFNMTEINISSADRCREQIAAAAQSQGMILLSRSCSPFHYLWHDSEDGNIYVTLIRKNGSSDVRRLDKIQDADLGRIYEDMKELF